MESGPAEIGCLNHAVRKAAVTIFQSDVCFDGDSSFLEGQKGYDIVNTLKTYDEIYLKAKTNFPYLIKKDGLFIRHETSDKPLVFDEKEGKVKEFDDPSIADTDFALFGEYEVNGEEVTPSFTQYQGI